MISNKEEIEWLLKNYKIYITTFWIKHGIHYLSKTNFKIFFKYFFKFKNGSYGGNQRFKNYPQKSENNIFL